MWGIPWRSFTLLKSGQRQVPSTEQLVVLAQVLELDPVIVFSVAAGSDAERVHAMLLAGDHESLTKEMLPRLMAGETDAEAGELDMSLRNVASAIFTLDLDRGISACNEILCLWTQKSKGELMGRRFCELLVPSLRGQIQGHLAEIYRRGTAGSILVEFDNDGRHVRWAELWGRRIDDVDGNARGIQLQAVDATERVAMQHVRDEEARQHRSLLESAPAMLLELDTSCTVLYANRGILGTAGSELVGRKFTEFVVPADQDRVERELGAAAESRSETHWSCHLIDSGVRRRAECYAGPTIREQAVAGFVILCCGV
jgi:PAS domain S-box-containing protein